MIIKQNLVPEAKYSVKCPYFMDPIGICVHNTHNDASAKNENSYVVNNPASGSMSYHFAVDDVEVYQNLPLNRNGWHAGDGTNGLGNRRHIGIEICYSKSGGERFEKSENNAAKLIAQLLQERGWSISKVKKHQDFSGKRCPHRTLDLGWDRFIKKIENNMAEMYKGLDLENKDSMKVAVDTWYEVVKENKYIKTAESERILNELRVKYEAQLGNLVTQNTQLLDTLKSSIIMLGLPENSGPDAILEAIKALKDASNQPNPPIGTDPGQLPITLEGNGKQFEISEVIYKVKN